MLHTWIGSRAQRKSHTRNTTHITYCRGYLCDRNIGFTKCQLKPCTALHLLTSYIGLFAFCAQFIDHWVSVNLMNVEYKWKRKKYLNSKSMKLLINLLSKLIHTCGTSLVITNLQQHLEIWNFQKRSLPTFTQKTKFQSSTFKTTLNIYIDQSLTELSLPKQK